jgi:hypothetical protein
MSLSGSKIIEGGGGNRLVVRVPRPARRGCTAARASRHRGGVSGQCHTVLTPVAFSPGAGQTLRHAQRPAPGSGFWVLRSRRRPRPLLAERALPNENAEPGTENPDPGGPGEVIDASVLQRIHIRDRGALEKTAFPCVTWSGWIRRCSVASPKSYDIRPTLHSGAWCHRGQPNPLHRGNGRRGNRSRRGRRGTIVNPPARPRNGVRERRTPSAERRTPNVERRT